MQPDRLHAGGVQQRDIQTVAALLLQHRVAQADALTALLKARGSRAIDQLQLFDRLVQSSGLRENAVDVLRLVGVKGRVARPLAEEVGRTCDDLRERGIVGHHKGAEQLGINADSLPLVKGKDGDFEILRGDFAVVIRQGQGEIARDPLGEVREIIDIEHQLDIVHTKGVLRGNIIKGERKRQNDFGSRGYVQRDAIERLLEGIIHCHGAHDGNVVLIERVVDDRSQLGGNGNVLFGIHNAFLAFS